MSFKSFPPPNLSSSDMASGSRINDPVASSLIRALRTKGSSAIAAPSVASPAPSRPYQDQIDSLNAVSNNISGSFQGAAFSSNSGYDSFPSSTQRQNSHARGMSSVSQQSFQTGGYSSRPASIVNYNGGGQKPATEEKKEPMSLLLLSTPLYEFLDDLTGLVENSPGVPKRVQVLVASEIRKFAQQYANDQRLLQLEIDQSMIDRNDLYSQLDEAQARLETAEGDRDRYVLQRDQLQRTVDDLRRKIADKLERTERQHKQQVDDLLKQVGIQEEQLKGKRALWLESHPGSSARRDQMNKLVRDPFDSPSTNHATSHNKNYTGHQTKTLAMRNPVSASVGTTSTAPPDAPRGPRRQRGGLPTGSAPRAQVMPNTSQSTTTNKIFNTHPASPPQASMALVPYTKDDDRAPEFQEDFTVIFKLLEGFAKTYCNIPNLGNDSKIGSSNQALWRYMMDCTYPGARQDAHSHVMAVINDPRSRLWFIMRMVINYLTNNVLAIEAWHGFNPATDADFAAVKEALKERGLANESRQALIDRQVSAVQTIVDSSTYQNFRTTQLTRHTKALRDLVGPLLNQGVSRAEAGRDLGACVVKGWETGVKMHTSFLTFQVYFPDTAGKFNASTMIAKDQPKADPMQLQIKQVRLKLVITPVITLRDDRDTTIKVKNLHHSTVLTMG